MARKRRRGEDDENEQTGASGSGAAVDQAAVDDVLAFIANTASVAKSIHFNQKNLEDEPVAKRKKVDEVGVDETPGEVPMYKKKGKSARQKKEEREANAGPGWFNMKAMRVDEKVERDLKVASLRGFIDPKVHYKRSDTGIGKLPKVFQVGKLISGAQDFYTAPTKRQAKKSLVDELLGDKQFKKYTKRKFEEARSKGRAGRKKTSKKRGRGGRKKGGGGGGGGGGW